MLNERFGNVFPILERDPVARMRPRPSPSLEWIQEFLPYRKVRILDVGAGTSVLVDHLLAAGYQRLSVLDISASALVVAQERLGNRKNSIQWIEADVTKFRAVEPFALWHDRNFFHGLTDQRSRQDYGHALWGSLLPGGLALIATCAPGGSTECQGVPFGDTDANALGEELGPAFQLRISHRIPQLGPHGERRDFIYSLFEKK